MKKSTVTIPACECVAHTEPHVHIDHHTVVLWDEFQRGLTELQGASVSAPEIPEREEDECHTVQ